MLKGQNFYIERLETFTAKKIIIMVVIKFIYQPTVSFVGDLFFYNKAVI